MPIYEISPLVAAVNEAWRRAPHLFVHVRRGVLDKCKNALDILKASLEPLLELTIRRISS